MATFTKLPLSGSINGRQIALSATGSLSANEIHTTPSGTTSIDEIWLYGYNDSTSSLMVTLLWGGVDDVVDAIRATITPRTGRTLLVDGKVLQNGLSVRGYASISGSIMLDGYVNRMTY